MDTVVSMVIGRISIVLIFILTFIIIEYVMNYASKRSRNMSEEEFEIRIPEGVSALCFGSFAFWSFLIIAVSTFWKNESVDAFVYSIFGFMDIFSLLTAIIILRIKVTVYHDEITVRPILGKVRKYDFSQITSTKENKNKNRTEHMIKVYTGKKCIFRFSEMYIGYLQMYRKLAQRNLI